MKVWKLIGLFCLLGLLMGCESKEEQIKRTIQQSIAKADIELQQLGAALDNGTLRNATLLKEYAKVLEQQQPDLAPIANALALDATQQGALYSGLVRRLDAVKATQPSPPYDNLLREIGLIREAVKPDLFNDALTDPLNMLADMSKGTLARVGAVSEPSEGEDVGNQLVGNPNYGQWQTGANGTSFWVWYGIYRMMDDVFDRYEYGRWSRHRKYSYYHDYGRYRYSSPKQLKSQRTVETRTKQNYQRQGKQFTSAYAKKRSGASGLSRSSYTPPQTRSSYSRNTGSVRNSSSRTSRGISRGK